MVNFVQAREGAYQELEQFYTIFRVDAKEKNHVGFSQFPDVWKIETEIFLPSGEITSVNLFLALPEDFPLTLPKVFLSKADYERTKYIPHVNMEFFVCAFDEENIQLNPDSPGRIADECIRRAKKIIEDGLWGRNDNDFDDEFIAYWTDKYDAKDKLEKCLSLLPEEGLKDNGVNALQLKKTLRGFSYVLFQPDSQEINHFKSYLTNYGIPADEIEGFYLGNIQGLQPPFYFTNEKTYQFVVDNFPSLEEPYRQFLNKRSYPKIIIFSTKVKDEHLYFGWIVPVLLTDRKGFRPGKLIPFAVYRGLQKNDPNTRLNIESITRKRLKNRTDGPSRSLSSLEITIAGLGSIGSNLLHYLDLSDVKSFRFIDPDYLTIENIGRHLLGISYIHSEKVTAMKKYFQDKNPLLDIETYNTSIVSILRNKPEVFNNSDFIFITIGKYNIEEFVIDSLATSNLIKPTFIIWIEPYLCGGHCLYLNPSHPYKNSDFYEGGFYKYNILSSEEYKNPDRKLLFREAGCQSSYTPFGQKHITLFLSSLIPYVNDLMESKERRNFRFTWKGNRQICKELNFTFSPTGKLLEFGQIESIQL